jgi:hypothetical protein
LRGDRKRSARHVSVAQYISDDQPRPQPRRETVLDKLDKEEPMSTRHTTDDTQTESIRIGPDDSRYLAVVDNRFNKRFRPSPDYVRLISSG